MYIGGNTAPTATLHLIAGTTTANTAPIKLTSGANLTTPENGAIEYDGTHLYYTDNVPIRQSLTPGAYGSMYEISAGTTRNLTAANQWYGWITATQDLNYLTTYLNDTTGLTPSQNSLLTTIKNSLRISNPNPAVGGQNEESVEEIRQNALANFGSQNRTVTVDDYISRVYSIPPRFGSIAKVMVIPNSDLSISTNQTLLSGFVNNDNETTLINNSLENNFRKVNFDVSNPFSLNLYVLSYNSNKNLTQINDALVYNIRQYLQKYKIISDSINIIDGYIINIGVDFKILVYNNFNKKEVLDQCLQKAKDFFNVDKWYFNQPININQFELELAKIEGVQSVAEVKFKNLTQNDGDYSPHEYNLSEATHNKIIYPSLDPSVFEVKYPDNDIRGAVI
jgi:hypothetical protein